MSVPYYSEPLRAPASWWAAGLGVSLLLAAAVHGGGDGLRAWLPYVLMPAATLLLLAWASRGQVRLVDDVLHVPGARVPVAVLGEPTALTAEQTRRLRGPTADLRAYVATTPWLRRAVHVPLEDPEDDTPYWLVGTRRPQELADAIAATRRRR